MPDAAVTTNDASRALFRLGRAFARLPLAELLEDRGNRGVELSSILVVQAVEAGEQAGRAVNVGDVAGQLGVDPSTASRLVAQSERVGFLRRRPSPTDGRSSVLELTDGGRALGASAVEYQRAVFDAATEGWTERERQEFARHFVRFAEAIVGALNDERQRVGGANVSEE